MDREFVKEIEDRLYDANLYVESFYKCKKGCAWKRAVQQYEANLLTNINSLIDSIKNDTYTPLPFHEFTLNERGRIRRIKAIDIKDRVFLRNFCDNILNPLINKYLIYDNGASVKGKGISFTRDRFETHLHKYYREHNTNEGYILFIDFTKYFDNIRHDKLMETFKAKIYSEKICRLLFLIIDIFKVDVSFMNDKEYKNCMNEIYNAIEYAKIDENLLIGEKYMYKSVGIGSQISQIVGIVYPIAIDNYCKIVKGIKYYGRYMDDTYIIHHDKEYLKEVLDEISKICDEYGIFINKKKTHIMKLNRTFTFLQTRYIFTETGKVVKKMSKSSIVRERRRLKKFRNLVDRKQMSLDDVRVAYLSWRGNLKNFSAYHVQKNMDKLYKGLFGSF